MAKWSQRQSPVSVLTRSSAENGDGFRRSFPGLIPSGCVNPEVTEMLKHRQRTEWGTGMNPTGHYTHMIEERGEKEIYPKQPRSF